MQIFGRFLDWRYGSGILLGLDIPNCALKSTNKLVMNTKFAENVV